MSRAILIVIIAAALTLLTVITINTFLMEGIRVLEKLTFPANVKISFNTSQCELIADHKEALTSRIPMIEYNCDLIKSHVVVFMNPKDLNITKLIVILKEFESPVSRDNIAQYYARGDERYVELINGTKLPMKMKLLYKVKVDQGGYIILKGSKEDIVNIKLIITYSDGHVKQFWSEYVGYNIEYVCLDSNA